MTPLALALALCFPRLIVAPAAVQAIEAAARTHEVPAEVLAAVCFHESTLRPRGWWCGVQGAQAIGQPDRAAHALARWRGVCGGWAGAIQMFRHGGGCRGRDVTGYVRRVLALARRLAGRGR